MKQVDYMAVADRAMKQIIDGAFLTVKSGQALNTMTIGWAPIGFIWRKPVMMVAVRLSRYTFHIIETAADFTVSIPVAGTLEEELTVCGTQSGRDYDKFKTCRLELMAGQKVVSPIINIPGLHYECKIIYKSAMDADHLAKGYDADIYPKKDYHTLYFGEIVACYEID
jgi:flavin reductase (DIM6/NTAB) family NADH-FMN oxidoreductase RutF